ncbi:MAG: serine/threonine protein kinase [Archangium sp.]
MSEVTSLLAPGVVIADTYEVERQLGRGGMGEVWLARHRRLAGKLVAIKVLHVDSSLPQEALSRFRREAEIAARLEHPNLVQVLDFNTLPSGQPYLVMEYLKGQSLAARAHGKQFTLEQVSAVMLQVGAGLQAAHKAGVVHRDLKPENIFLVPTALGDQVKVLDFGISKLSDSNTVQTTDSVLIGTPLYMSPEQAMGLNRDVTAQSDLFSLGSICFELFTGTTPFQTSSIATVVFRIAYEKPPSLAALRPDLSPQVIHAIEHALEKEREKRTRDIETFVLELTGQALATVQDDTHGVFQPGMNVSPSMLSGATRAPSSGAMATPIALSKQVDSGPPPARTVSGRKVIVGIIAITVVLAAVITKVRMDNWAERERYRAGMRDAGYVMLADGNFVIDAGVKQEAVRDAGAVAVAEVDAGTPEVVDAGVAVAQAEPVKPKVVEPPTAEELEILKGIDALEKQGQWDVIWEARPRYRTELKTQGARSRAWNSLVLAACNRSDNAQLMIVINELKAVAVPGQMKAVRAKCLAKYPSAEYLNW